MAKSTLVIGGGIVGLACAVEAQIRGQDVTLVERAEPGHGCSFGNAGILAVSEIFPLITPARLKLLPHMLLSREAPAVIRLGSAAQMLPWMLRAAGKLAEAHQLAIVSGLAALNGKAIPAWRGLLAACEASSMLRERGMIRMIRDPADAATLVGLRDRLAVESLRSSLLGREVLRELEPQIGRDVAGGLFHESDADIGDPLAVSQMLLARFEAGGGRRVREAAIAIRPRERGAELTTSEGTHLADTIVVAAGLASGDLLAPFGLAVPLQAERGYHLMLRGGGELLSRPVTFQRESCVATPMGAGLRLAGTVEFAQDGDRPDWTRADRLAGYAGRYFNEPLPSADTTRWIGSRPSLPDSLPAIGRLKQAPSIGYAFGHQHLGVTQAAITARLLLQVMADENTIVPARPYDLARFG